MKKTTSLIFTNTFQIEPELQDKLTKVLKESLETIISKQKGFIDGSILKSMDRRHVQVVARWRNVADIEATKNNPENAAYMKQVQELGAKAAPSLYEVFFTVGYNE